MGADYTRAFNPIWPALAKKYDVPLVPFFLQPVIGNKALLLGDNIHPNAQGIDRRGGAQGDVAKALKAAEDGQGPD
jgi:acyl-CoA thioesterase-1